MENPKSASGIKSSKQEFQNFYTGRDCAPVCDLWTDGLICAFEFVRGSSHTTTAKHSSRSEPMYQSDDQNIRRQLTRTVPSHPPAHNFNDNNTLRGFHSLLDLNSPTVVRATEGLYSPCHMKNAHYKSQSADSHWVPIGWGRISELVQIVQVDAKWSSQQLELMEDEDDFTVAGVAAPYWERPEGPIWWCHVSAGHSSVDAWLSNAHWLHPAISIALRDESRLISERMKYLLYEVPVRVAGGLLFELLGQSVGDPFCNEDDIPIVLRSWQTQKFLVTAMHVKGSASNINVLGITEVQELLLAGGNATPKSVHEVIAHLACRLARWDDR